MTLLHDKALQSLKRSYAPYTQQPVGVAIKTTAGSVYSGSTFENAAYMHGLEPLEAALGTLLIKENWVDIQTLPTIATVHFCQNQNSDQPDRYYPPIGSLALLRILGRSNTIVSYTGTDETIMAQHDLDSLFQHWPSPPYDQEAFLTFAKNRKDSTVPPDRFNTAALRPLFRARLQAFDPVSRYAVAAMIETSDGETFYGVNCEPGGNKALHAEATAIASMITARGAEQTISQVTILTAGRPGFPCGGCRQYIREFSNAETMITAMNTAGESETVPFDALLPRSFGPEDLRSGSRQ